MSHGVASDKQLLFISFSVRVWYSLVFFVIGSHAEIEYKAKSGIIISCQSGVEASVADTFPPIMASYER
jgi:hypothetical protein